MFPPPLFAFGFESLPMLGWLAAGAAPWLIHLLSRRKHRETAWAAMDFLLSAMRRQARRLQFEQWLLLAVRTLVIVTLVTAVAEPYLQHALAVLSPSGAVHRVLVIDSSYSMGYKAGPRTRFEEAKQWAARMVRQSSPGDGFTLVEMAAPPRVIVATPGVEPGPIEQEIENLELLHTGADLAATLAEVRKLLDVARRDNPRFARQEVCFFSDLQRGTWLPAMNDAQKAEFRSRAQGLAAIADLEVIDLGRPGDDNLAVTSLTLHDPLVLAGRGVALEAGVRDFGGTSRQRQAVDLLIDGSAAGRQYIDIPAGGSGAASFNARFDSAGDHAVEVRLTGDALKAGDIHGPTDALEVDNHRYLAVHVRQALRVLCIDGRPAGDPRKSSVFNLGLALAARSDPNRSSTIEYEVAGENAVLERDLARYDCLVLSDVAQFTASEARVLDNYLLHGGSLVFFLGERVNAENYNGVLAAPPRPVLPARLAAVARNPGGRLDPRDYRHAILEKFRHQEKAKLLESPVEKYFKVQLAETPPAGKRSAATRGENAHVLSNPSSPAEVVLAMSNGDPLIVAQTVHRGRVVLVTTSADTSWGLLPLWGTYEPLIKEILLWCTAGQAQPRNVNVGDPLEATLQANSAVMSVSVECPGGQAHSVPLEVQGDSSSWRYDDTRTSGIYTARLGPPLSQDQLFAVNLATAESNLATISRDELQNEVWPGVPVAYQTTFQASGESLPAASAASVPLHVELFYAVLALLLLETLLAWRFGYNA